MKIVVTGASGFVGGRAAQYLADAGHEVIGLGRKPNGWVHERGSYLRADLTELSSQPLVLGVDVVVHAAASTLVSAPLADMLRVNRDVVAGLPVWFPGARIVHISSSSVYAADRHCHMLREDAPHATRFLSSYSASKFAAERLLERMPEGRDAIVLRPHGIYGAGDHTLMPKFEALLRGRILPLPGGARSPHTLTSIENLVRAIELACEPGAPAGTYNIADANVTMLDDVVREALAVRGHGTVRILNIPEPIAHRLAIASERLARAGRITEPSITRYAIHSVAHEKTLDTSRAQECLGFVPAATDVSGAATW